jgi:hypothetical protein
MMDHFVGCGKDIDGKTGVRRVGKEDDRMGRWRGPKEDWRSESDWNTDETEGKGSEKEHGERSKWVEILNRRR